MSFGLASRGDTVARLPSSVKASVIWRSATALSTGTTGMSPQSRMVAQFWYGLMLARGLKPRKVVWRDEAWRMARGPNLAPVEGESRTYRQPKFPQYSSIG